MSGVTPLPAARASREDEDVLLVQAMARGDRASLGELYDRYAPLLMSLGQRVLPAGKEVEDLLHDVLLEAWRMAKTYDPRRGSVRAWLCMRMRSRALDRVRAAGRAKVVLHEDGTGPERESPEDPSVAPDRRRVRRALASLAVEQRQVLELGYFQGMSSSEISQTLDIPVGTVKSRISRGLAQLRRDLIQQKGGAQ